MCENGIMPDAPLVFYIYIKKKKKKQNTRVLVSGHSLKSMFKIMFNK